MRTVFSVILGAIVLACAGSAAAQTIEFRNVAARVVIIPEAQSDIQVIFLKTDPRQPLKVVKGMGDTTVVERTDWFGWFWGPHPNCNSSGGDPDTYVPKIGEVAYADLPQITVRVPMDASVNAGGATYGSVGRSHSLHLRVAGCGEWTVANVQDDLTVVFAGAGRLHTGSVGNLRLNIAGAATTTTTAVQNGLMLEIAGVGNVHVGQASGDVGIHLAGGGNVRIDGGQATNLDIHIAGSGDVDYGGTAGSLSANIAGSGDIRAAKVTGAVNKFIAGSGSVEIGQ
jgi:hypothetical protein